MGSRSPLAEIDPDVFTDFATVRPQVRLDEDHHRSIVWPTVGVWSVSLPGTDVILVLGPEPALRWRLFTEQLVGIAERFDVSMALSLGALLADVPHSRPVPLIGTATDDTMIERFELQRSQYEGPTGIVGVLQDALHRHGLSTASLWAAVPGYASQIPSPKAAMALVERACSMIGTPAPLSRLAVAAAEYDARVSSLIGDDDDMVEYLHRLEQLADDGAAEFELEPDDDDDESTPATSPRRSTPMRWSKRSNSSCATAPTTDAVVVSAVQSTRHTGDRTGSNVAADSSPRDRGEGHRPPPLRAGRRLRAAHRRRTSRRRPSPADAAAGRRRWPRQWNRSMYMPKRLNPIRWPSTTPSSRSGSHSMPVSSSTSFTATSAGE